jgi:polar amino acid transport system substrate-binding protein
MTALVTAAALLLTSWAVSPVRAAKSTAPSESAKLHGMLPKAIQQAGKIMDVVNLPYPPMEFQRPGSSAFTGFDIDMATAIAHKLGVGIQFENVQFPQIFPSVKTHRGDLAWTAVFDLRAREKNFNFIDYFKTGTQLYIAKSGAATIHSFKDLCGKTVAVPTGTFFGKIVQSLSKSACTGGASIQQVLVPSPTEQNLQIREGRAVAAVSGVETVLYLMKQQPGQWALLGKILQPDYYAVVFAKDSGQLMRAMRAAMNVAWHDGTYRRILAKWGLTLGALPKPRVNSPFH